MKKITCPICGSVVEISEVGLVAIKDIMLDENGKVDESCCYADSEIYYTGEVYVYCPKCFIEEKFETLQDFVDNGFKETVTKTP